MEYLTEIGEKQSYLNDTDYVANKLSEVVAKCLIYGDNSLLIEFNSKYSNVLQNRESYRQRISELNDLLNTL